MKLCLPFRKRVKDEQLATPEREDPVAELGQKLTRIEEKLDESEQARIDESLELKRRIEEINRANRENSAGSVRGVQSDYFSYNEVKEMTPAQVRKNFSRIVDSMGKWN